MNFDSYVKQGRGLYGDFAATVAAILSSAIQREKNLRLQHLQHRAKDATSLQKKLAQRGVSEDHDIETDIKDLAGCRVVFYTNSDVSRFLSSGIVADNFEIDWERTKIHYPVPSTANATELFIANNYVVRLKDGRIALAEYAAFAGLLCEVQVQTALHHAWSEMAHDTIYKKPALEGGFGGELMKGIEERMQAIMRDHLLPAGYEFQKVVTDFERLSSGKELFDRGALKALDECTDNNARFELLQRFIKYVLPNYDDPAGVQTDVRTAMIAVVKASRESSAQPIQTPFGSWQGYSALRVAGTALDVIDRLRYIGIEAVEATFDALAELVAGSSNDDEKKRIIKSANRLAAYDKDAWSQAGPVVQQALVKRIKQINVANREPLRPLILEALPCVLDTEIRGQSSTHDTVTFHRGVVASSNMLAALRVDAIEILFELLKTGTNDSEQGAVIGALAAAMRAPTGAAPSAELWEVVLSDAQRIVAFYASVADTLSFELRQKLEHNMLWLYRHNRGPAIEGQSEKITAARKRLVEQIFAFRDLINHDRAFVVYKTLVGYQSVFAPEWEGDPLNYTQREQHRKSLSAKLLDEVTEASADEWLKILVRCAKTESDDLATFPSFAEFLESLGHSKPEIVTTYLDRLEGRFANFLPAILKGLENGPTAAEVQLTVRAWLEHGQHLSGLMRYARSAEPFDIELASTGVKKAIECDDHIATLYAVDAAIARHGDVVGGLVEPVFLPAVMYLEKCKDTRWVNGTWHVEQAHSIFTDLKPDQVDLILAALRQHAKIDYSLEQILCSIASKWPEKAVDFLVKRIEAEPPGLTDVRYEALSDHFEALPDRLRASLKYVLAKAHEMFTGDSSLFVYRGGRLVHALFPAFTSELESELSNMVRSAVRADLEFVVCLLRNYGGENAIHGLCKTIIDALPEDDALLGDIEASLDHNGMVSGTFGVVEALEQKKLELQSWLTDPRDKVKAFASRHIRDLEQQMASEQRRAEEGLEMRKREYG